MPTELTRYTDFPASSNTVKSLVRNEVILNATVSTTATTGTTVANLFTAAQGIYLVECLLFVTSAAATTGVQLGLTGPTSGVTASAVRVQTASAAGTELVSHQALNDYQAAVAGLTTLSIAKIEAHVQFGSGVPATAVNLAVRSEVSGSAVAVRFGSSIEWRKVS